MELNPNKLFFLPKVPPKKTPMDKLRRATKTTKVTKDDIDEWRLHFASFQVLMPKDDLDDPKYTDWTLVQNTSYHKDWCTGKWLREFHWCRFQLDNTCYQVLQARRGPTLGWYSVTPEMEDRLNQFLSKKNKS